MIFTLASIMLVSCSINETVIILLLVAFKVLLILYARFLITEAFKFINIAVWHPIYYGKQLSGFNKFLWFLMTPILSVIFAFFLGIVIPIFVWVKFTPFR